MESPFRDDRVAAHMRAEQLAEENEQLRRELEEAKKPKDQQSGMTRQRIPLVAVATGIAALGIGLGVLLYTVEPARPVAVSRAHDGEHVQVKWTAENAPTTSALRGVWTDGRDTYAVGEAGTILYERVRRLRRRHPRDSALGIEGVCHSLGEQT